MSRRESTPNVPIPPGQVHGTRRVGGLRQEATERVSLRGPSFQTTGWTLNVSRGGARLVVEDSVEPGSFYHLTMGQSAEREVRIVWVQDEADGQIVGVQFVDIDGSVPEPPSAPAHESTGKR